MPGSSWPRRSRRKRPNCAAPSYYRARCAQSAREGRYRLLDWLAWADLEIDNIRAVLRRCLDRGDAATGLHLSASLGWYWITRATSEGIRWLEEFVAAKDTADADPQVLGWAQFMRGFLAVLKADPAAAGPPLHAAVAVARQTGQRQLLSEALSMAAVVANMAGDRAEARRLLGEADAAAASLGRAYPSGLIAVLQARALDGFFGRRSRRGPGRRRAGGGPGPGDRRPVRARDHAAEPGLSRAAGRRTGRGQAATHRGAADRPRDR